MFEDNAARKAFIFSNLPICMMCRTNQVECVDWSSSPAKWKCRRCGFRFAFEPIEDNAKIRKLSGQSISWVSVDDITTEGLKSKVEKWPPDILKAEFGDKTFYYELKVPKNE